MLAEAIQMYLDDASVDEFHADLESELERLQSYHQQHADDAAKMSGKAPNTILLNEEDWNEWGQHQRRQQHSECDSIHSFTSCVDYC